MKRPTFATYMLGAALVAAALAATVVLLGLAARAAGEPPRTGTLDATIADFGRLLAKHVDGEGFVDYAGMARDREALDRFVSALASPGVGELRGEARLAMLINAYNAMMLQMVLDAGGPEAVKNVLDDLDEPFKAKRFFLAGERVSLDDVEHGMIREEFDEPRIHWAVNCGAESCPPLRREAYVAGRLDEQLAEQERRVMTSDRFVSYDGGDTIELTALFDWYGEDFAGGDVLAYVAENVPAVKERLDAGKPLEVAFKDYDWMLNAQGLR